MNFCRQVGTTADPQAKRSESSSQVPSLQLVSLPAKRGQRHLSHTAVQGAVGSFHKNCGCGKALPASASISCPSWHVSAATVPVVQFLSISQTDHLPLLCWIFGLMRAFSSSRNLDPQTLESPRHQGLIILTELRGRFPLCSGTFSTHLQMLLCQGLFCRLGVLGFFQRTQEVMTEPHKKQNVAMDNGLHQGSKRCGFKS